MKQLKYILVITLLLIIFSMSFSFAESNLPTIYSPTVLLMESRTGDVVFEKNGYEKRYPASTTKIMTAILVLENCNLTDTAKVSLNAINSVPSSYSNINLQPDEELTINQLLNVLMIGSANDAANVLAEHIAGSVESFCTMMNSKANEIGCKNTHFVNPNGVHNKDHYSTAYDLALMARYAMQNEEFRKLVITPNYTLPATNKYDKNDRVVTMTNLLLNKDTSDKVDNYYYEYATGIKTGYTNSAKDCIVASAKKDGKEYIVVVLGAEKTENGLSSRYLDCKNLFKYAFENYSVKILHEKGSILRTIKVDESSDELTVIVEKEISVCVKNTTDFSTINPTVEIKSDLETPVLDGTVIGKITYNIEGKEYSSDLLSGSSSGEFNLIQMLIIIGILLAILFFLSKKSKQINNKKNNKNYLFG